MATHERDQKIRRVTRVVIYFLLIAFFIILFFMVSRWNNGQKQSQPEPGNAPVTYVAPQDYS